MEYLEQCLVLKPFVNVYSYCYYKRIHCHRQNRDEGKIGFGRLKVSQGLLCGNIVLAGHS